MRSFVVWKVQCYLFVSVENEVRFIPALNKQPSVILKSGYG
jgi:hypothetical protein